MTFLLNLTPPKPEQVLLFTSDQNGVPLEHPFAFVVYRSAADAYRVYQQLSKHPVLHVKLVTKDILSKKWGEKVVDPDYCEY